MIFVVLLNQQLHNSQSPLFPFVGPPGERYILIVGLWQAVGAVIKQFLEISKCTICNCPCISCFQTSHLSCNIFRRCKQHLLSLFMPQSLNWHNLPKQIILQSRSPLHKKSRLQSFYSNREINMVLMYSFEGANPWQFMCSKWILPPNCSVLIPGPSVCVPYIGAAFNIQE